MDNSKPLAIRYADAVDQIDAQRKSIDALSAQVAQLEVVTADNVALQAKVTELEASIVATGEAHNAAIVEKATHIETLTAEVTALKGQLALSPAHLDLSAGAKALKDGNLEGADATWDVLLASNGGDYVKTRKENPAAFAKKFQLK
jgi:hypothetical protein